MSEENREKIIRLANLARRDIGRTEEDVKINFIVPLFEAFGHERLRFEHRWTDALVETGELVIETKKYDKGLDTAIEQLNKYCSQERPLLGIIANGTQIRIFSYFWWGRKFGETLIYCINREDLKHESIIQTLENILSRSNLDSGQVRDFIMKREREIEDAENKIKGIKREAKGKIEELQTEIDTRNVHIDNLKKEIGIINSEKGEITTKIREQISQIWGKLGFPQPPFEEEQGKNTKGNGTGEGDEPSYIPRYRKMLKSPNTYPSRIKRYIEEKGSVIYKDLQDALAEKYNYRSKRSGSFKASIHVLELDGYIKVEGKGDEGRIVSTKKVE